MGTDPGRGLIGVEVVAGEVAAAFRPVLAAGGFDRMRRMASAAAAKKCPRPSQRWSSPGPTSRRYAS